VIGKYKVFDEKLTNKLFIVTNKLFQKFVTMSAQNGEEDKPEGNDNQQPHRNTEHPSESSSTTQVLETMRNLIVDYKHSRLIMRN
jgi:hypothetical protein